MKKVPRVKKPSGAPEGGIQAPAKSSVFTIAKYVGVVLAVILAVTMWKRSQHSVQDLTSANVDTLKDAFFGELPYLFFCSKGGKDEKLPTPFSEVNTAKGSSMGFAKVNCSQLLPSGKNLWERFKLKKEVRPTVFATAPWMKPQQVAANHLKDAKTLTKYVDSAMAPKPTQIVADKDLQKYCGFDKNKVTDVREISDTCVVVLRGTRYTKVHTDLEKKLILQYPRVRFAAVNAAKKRLSLEEGADYLAADHFALKIHALRNGTHFMSMVTPATWDYLNTFVSQALSTPLYGYSGDGNVPVRMIKARTEDGAAEPRKPRTRKFPKQQMPPADYNDMQGKAAEQSTTSGSTTETAASPAQPEVDPEVAEAERIRKERLRREQMERQAQEHLFSQADDTDSGDAEGEEEGDEDDEGDGDAIEL